MSTLINAKGTELARNTMNAIIKELEKRGCDVDWDDFSVETTNGAEFHFRPEHFVGFVPVVYADFWRPDSDEREGTEFPFDGYIDQFCDWAMRI